MDIRLEFTTVNEIYIKECRDYENIKKKMGELFEEYGELNISPGDRVLLKPNLITDKFSAITHPEFTRAVGEIISDYGGKVEIADSTGSGKESEDFRESGYTELGFTFYLFDEFGVKEKHGFPLTEKLDDYDFIVNLPKIKTHLLTTLTLGVKNLFGLIPGRRKKRYHVIYPDGYSFSRMLFSLYRSVKTDLTVMDGIAGMEGEGPTGGEEVPIGLIALSEDPMVMDYGLSEVLSVENFPLRQIYKEIFGEMDYKITGKINEFPEIELPSSVVGKIGGFGRLRRILRHRVPRPVRENCTLCGNCEENCPVKAIEIEHGNVYVNYSLCIECFTCLEVCNYNALEVKERIGFQR